MANALHYARLLASRGRIYLNENETNEMNGDAPNGGVPDAKNIHANLARALFFV